MMVNRYYEEMQNYMILFFWVIFTLTNFFNQFDQASRLNIYLKSLKLFKDSYSFKLSFDIKFINFMINSGLL